MSRFNLLLLFLLSFTFATIVPMANGQYSTNRILKADIKSLVLRSNAWTTSRRSAPLQQLTCKSGCHLGVPNTVLCENKGSDGTDHFNWKCETQDLVKGVRFGLVEINCEGYDNIMDPFVLIGSCAMEYSLIGTPMNQILSPVNIPATSTTTTTTKSMDYIHKSHWQVSDICALLLILVFICIVMSTLDCCNNRPSRIHRRAHVDPVQPVGPDNPRRRIVREDHRSSSSTVHHVHHGTGYSNVYPSVIHPIVHPIVQPVIHTLVQSNPVTVTNTTTTVSSAAPNSSPNPTSVGYATSKRR